eukprot:gene31526-6709_t
MAAGDDASGTTRVPGCELSHQPRLLSCACDRWGSFSPSTPSSFSPSNYNVFELCYPEDHFGFPQLYCPHTGQAEGAEWIYIPRSGFEFGDDPCRFCAAWWRSWSKVSLGVAEKGVRFSSQNFGLHDADHPRYAVMTNCPSQVCWVLCHSPPSSCNTGGSQSIGPSPEEYLIRWAGYGIEQDTWESAKDIDTKSPQIVTAWLQRSQRDRDYRTGSRTKRKNPSV